MLKQYKLCSRSDKASLQNLDATACLSLLRWCHWIESFRRGANDAKKKLRALQLTTQIIGSLFAVMLAQPYAVHDGASSGSFKCMNMTWHLKNTARSEGELMLFSAAEKKSGG